jgi:hypothetical protein
VLDGVRGGVGVGDGEGVGVGVGVGVRVGVGVLDGVRDLTMLRCLCKIKYITNDITATLSNNIAIFRRLDSADINSFSPHKIKNLIVFA